MFFSRHSLARRALARAALPLVCLSSGACGAVPPAIAPAPSAGPVVSAPAALGSTKIGTFRSERFELDLPLPDGRTWRIDDHSGPWLSATHTATSSALIGRTWTEEGRVTHARCEQRARLWKQLPEPLADHLIEQRTIDAPAGFDTTVQVAVVPGSGPAAPVSAHVLAFGGHAHRCFAYVYTTTASGALAEQVVAERLATMVQRSLSAVSITNELVPRIPRTPGSDRHR